MHLELTVASNCSITYLYKQDYLLHCTMAAEGLRFSLHIVASSSVGYEKRTTGIKVAFHLYSNQVIITHCSCLLNALTKHRAGFVALS